MNTELKQKIYDLIESGRSLNSVAKELGIGKTTVHTTYHKLKEGNENRSERSEERNDEQHIPETNINKTSHINSLFNISSSVSSHIISEQNVPVTEVLSGPFVELIDLLPLNFKGIIESKKEEAATKFAWHLACFLSQFHSPVEIITDNFNKFSLMLLINHDPGYDKIKLWRCTSLEQVKNEIQRTPAKIVLIDSLQTLKISPNDWKQLIESNPDKAIIGVSKQVEHIKPELHFVARIVMDTIRNVVIEHQYGEIREFYLDLGVGYFYQKKAQ
jgi:hypothetical protein